MAANADYARRKETIEDGDEVIVFGGRELLTVVQAQKKKFFQNRKGRFSFDDVIGKPFGTKVASRNHQGFVYVLHPTPELWAQVLPHRTQIIFSPDISMIIMNLDLAPGSVVVESGTGSGALTHAFARAVGEAGHVYTFDFHEQRVEIARKEFELHNLANTVTVGHADATSEQGFSLEGVADAVFFDLPKPHLAINNAIKAFKPSGGRICSFSPCIEQVAGTCAELRKQGFVDVSTLEVLERVQEVSKTSIPALDFLKFGERVSKAAEGKDKEEAPPSKKKKRHGSAPKQEMTSFVSIQPSAEDRGHTGYLTFATWLPAAARDGSGNGSTKAAEATENAEDA